MTTTPSVYRIGIDARLYRSQTGGIGRYSRELIAHVAALDHVNEYYVFLTEEDAAEWHCENPNFYPVVTSIKHYSPQEQTAFLRLLSSYKLDLVHFLNFNHPVAYTKPFVVTLHDLTILHKPEATKESARGGLKRKAFELVLKRAVSKAKKVIAVSEFTAHDAERSLGVSHAKMEVIYEGAPQRFEIPFGSKKHVQDYLGTKDPYILFVSQWREHKGILTLLDAFAQLKAVTGAPLKLVLLGRQEAASPAMREALANSPVATDIITPGFAPEELLPALYTYAHAFVMPSESEGFGLPVLEAMAYGTPCVIARNSSLPEVGGDAALYFETKNAADLAHQLHVALTDGEVIERLRAHMPRQLAKFHWHSTAQQTLALYMNLLEKHR